MFFPSKVYGSISVSGQLPTYPSPNSTTVNWQQVKVNVGLGEGQVGSYLDTDVDPGLLGYMQALRAEERMKIGRRQMIFFSSYYFVFTLLKKRWKCLVHSFDIQYLCDLYMFTFVSLFFLNLLLFIISGRSCYESCGYSGSSFIKIRSELYLCLELIYSFFYLG